MKKLYIMRHASAASSGVSDKERPLNFEGRKQLADLLVSALGLFDDVTHVLCSTATRTKLTSAGLREIIPVHAHYQFLDNLYHASAYSILEEIKLLPNEAKDVLVIAHNPGVSQFASLTSPEMTLAMATAQIAIYDIHSTDWQALEFSDCRFRKVI
jgi:phosphohistidine phosphatase